MPKKYCKSIGLTVTIVKFTFPKTKKYIGDILTPKENLENIGLG